MDSNTPQNTEENKIEENKPEKKKSSGGVLYGIAIGFLSCVILVSVFFLAQNYLKSQKALSSTKGPGNTTAAPKPTQNSSQSTATQSMTQTPQSTATQSTTQTPQSTATQGTTHATQSPTAGSTGSPTGSTATEPPPGSTATEPPSGTESKPDIIEIGFSEFYDDVYLIGEAAQAYLQAEEVPFVSDFMRPYLAGGIRQDVGVPVELAYTVYSMPEDCHVTSAVFWVAETEDFNNAMEFVPDEGECSVLVPWLYTGRQYYYRAYITLSDGSDMEFTGSFHTAATPRILTIDGIINVRDIGGWQTTDGRIIKQGLLYRGSEIDGFVEPTYLLTEKGLEQMRNQLGIRMDMDLRFEGENALGPDVKHTCYDALQYSLVFTSAGSNAIRRIFSDLANPDNYPIYLHCTYGADRTGTICYLLEALLGVSDKDLIRDYELTALTYGFVSTDLMDPFVQQIADYEGKTTQEKVENFLLTIGVTEQEIASIRNIFL